MKPMAAVHRLPGVSRHKTCTVSVLEGLFLFHFTTSIIIALDFEDYNEELFCLFPIIVQLA